MINGTLSKWTTPLYLTSVQTPVSLIQESKYCLIQVVIILPTKVSMLHSCYVKHEGNLVWIQIYHFWYKNRNLFCERPPDTIQTLPKLRYIPDFRQVRRHPSTHISTFQNIQLNGTKKLINDKKRWLKI